MIHIVDNLYLKIDKYSYVLMIDTSKLDKDGNKKFVCRYPTTIDGVVKDCLKYLCEQKISDDKVIELKDTLEFVNESKEEILNAINDKLDIK